jgi:hypothetical protein
VTVHHAGLLAAAQRCGWPAVTLPGTRSVLRGPEGWQDVVYRLSPRERARLLRTLGQRELLVCTPGGRHRLRTWLDRRWAGPWEATPPRVRVYGDAALVPAIDHALARLPRPVHDYIVESCLILAVGASIAGWTTVQPLPVGLPIQISGAAFEAIVHTLVHEAAHQWHAPPRRALAEALSLAEGAEVLAAARADGWPIAAAEARKAEDERLAELCAVAWAQED